MPAGRGFLARVSAAGLVAGCVALFGALPAHAATRPVQVLGGGGPQVPAELRLPAGGSIDGLFPLFVRNTGPAPVAVRVTEQVPSGITFAPEMRDATVAPRTSVSISYKLRVDSTLAAGRYKVEIDVLPSDLAVTQGSVQFVQAVSQRFTVVVDGTAGDLKASARDVLEQKAIAGTFTASRITGVNRVPVARAEGKTLEARVVPGEYEVAFELDGRTIASKTVQVNDGKTTDAQIDVSLLQFTKIDATRIDANGKIAAVAVQAQFDNALRPLANATISLMVRREGKQIDDIPVQQFQTLAKGAGSVATRYVPRDGWKDGKYEFRFRLSAEGVTVAAADRPTVQVGRSPGAGFPWKWAAAFVAVVMVALAALAWLLRRMRRNEGDPDDPLAGRRIQRVGLSGAGIRERRSRAVGAGRRE